MADAAVQRSSRTRLATLGLLVLALGLALRALFLTRTHRVPLQLMLGWKLHALELGLGLAVALVVRASIEELRELRAGAPRERPLESLRWAFVVAVLGWLLFLWLVQPFQRIWFDMALGAAAGAWALVLLVRTAVDRHRRLFRTVDLVISCLCAAVVGLELGLRGWASLAPTPLNTRIGAAPGDLIQRFRCKPGQVHFGFACNSGGYYDTEFSRRSPGDQRRRIVAIGDSFNLGMVPHAWHFTTLCEELLGAEIDNMGVPGIGPPEYLNLLVEEALPLAPDLILIGVFVGNDLNVADVHAELPDAGLRSWLQRDQVLLFVLPERMSRVAELDEYTVLASGRRAQPMDREEAARAFPFVSDPGLEEATYTSENFLRIETTRALDVCARVPPAFDLFQRSMLDAKRAAGDTPLRVMLIPEEFQVEDELWGMVCKGAGRELDRTAPQRLLTTWLAEQGIPCLDLLPVFQRVPPGPDGKRHLYHQRDTHFNARGNEVTAAALAEFLR